MYARVQTARHEACLSLAPHLGCRGRKHSFIPKISGCFLGNSTHPEQGADEKQMITAERALAFESDRFDLSSQLSHNQAAWHWISHLTLQSNNPPRCKMRAGVLFTSRILRVEGNNIWNELSLVLDRQQVNCHSDDTGWQDLHCPIELSMMMEMSYI